MIRQLNLKVLLLLTNLIFLYTQPTTALAQESTPSASIKNENISHTAMTVQSNSATIINTINTSASTGNNNANFNSGGNVTINTGPAKAATTVQNYLNSNSKSKNEPKSKLNEENKLQATNHPSTNVKVTSSLSPQTPPKPQQPIPKTNLKNNITKPLKTLAQTNLTLANSLDNQALISPPKNKSTPTSPPNLLNTLINILSYILRSKF